MKTKLPSRVAINERRAYFECFCGQLHVRTAFPSTGGFDERRPLLCLHDLAATSASFAGLISAMGTDRSIYAIDLPGHGESDPPPQNADVAAFAEAVADLIKGLRLREVDVLGQGFGAAVAAELAALKDGIVRSLVLIDAPMTGAEDWPEWAPNEEGDGLAEVFRAGRHVSRERESLPAYTARFAEALCHAKRVNVARAALASWSAAERWRQVRHPALAVDIGRRRPVVADALPAGRSLDGATLPHDAFLRISDDLAARLRTFLDASG
jgi:pimeloyl-ACP methyl ester carboxylesterase